MSEETRSIYVEREGCWEKLTFPAECRVTFGPLLPGRGAYEDGRGKSGQYLRIYKTKDHQLAVIPNVTQFRDADVVRETGGSKGFEQETETDLIAETVRYKLVGEEGKRGIQR